MIKVLIAGYGSIGKRHLENFLQFKDIQLIVYKKRLERKFDSDFSNNLDTYSSYVEELKHFLKCVKHRKETINNLEQGIATLKIALAIKKASKLMKSVNV